MPSDIIFQIVLFLVAVIIGLWGQYIKSEPALKRAARIFSVLLILIVILWVGYAWGRKDANQNPTTNAPVNSTYSQTEISQSGTAVAGVKTKPEEKTQSLQPTLTLPAVATPSPIASNTPLPPTSTVTSTPDPRLFWDDFDAGIRPDWQINGDNYGMIDGHLTASGLFSARAGDPNWEDYVVEFDMMGVGVSYFNVKIIVRWQSETDYMSFQFNNVNFDGRRWVVTENGNDKEIVVKVGNGGHYRIEVRGNTYTTFCDGNQLVVFTDNKIKRGNVGIKVTGGAVVTLDNFEVWSLP